MGGDDRDVDLEGFVAALDLEVVEDQVGFGQVIAQVGNRPPFGVVDRITYRDDLGHYGASSIACSRPCVIASLSS